MRMTQYQRGFASRSLFFVLNINLLMIPSAFLFYSERCCPILVLVAASNLDLVQKQKRKSILMAIASNPHTNTGILFDSPWLKVMQFLVAVTILILWFWFICIFPSLH